MIEAVNGWYEKDKIAFISPEGEIKLYNFADLEYPYFYSDIHINGYGVVKSEDVVIKILDKFGIIERKVRKIYTENPAVVKKIKRGQTYEADIKYLERRIGADNIVKWVLPKVYAYIDIEVEDGEITVIGAMKNIDNNYVSFKTPADFLNWLKSEKITLVIAWNGEKYDYKYLDKNIDDIYWRGVMKVDAMKLYSKYISGVMRGLDWVGKEEGFGGKLDIKTADLIEYNKRDVELMKLIIEKYKLIELIYGLAELTGIKPDIDNLREISMIENLIMKNRDKFGVYLKDKIKHDEEKKGYQGAYIYIKEGGIYENIADFDYNSLYPSVIIFEDYHGKSAFIWAYWKLIMKFLYEKKEENRGKDEIKYDAYKRLLNGAYGLFGNVAFRYFDEDIAAFVAAKAREKILELKAIIEGFGKEVIYIDTDSAFVRVENEDEAKRLEKIINKKVYPYKVKLDAYFKRIFFIERDGEAIKKRYAGITSAGKTIITGLEVVRSDYCFLARDIQRQIIDIILSEKDNETKKEEIKKLLRAVKRKIYNREFSLDEIEITKSIDMEREYKVKTQALKALEQVGGNDDIIQFIEFYFAKNEDGVIAKNCGLSEAEIKRRIDIEAYWERQIVAVVEKIIGVLGLTITDIFSRRLEVWAE